MKLVPFIEQFAPPKSRFKVENIPDQTGKVAIVTGGSSGIGFEITKALLVKNAKVYMATRNRDKALAAIEKLRRETGRVAFFLYLDLSDLSSVRRSMLEFRM